MNASADNVLANVDPYGTGVYKGLFVGDMEQLRETEIPSLSHGATVGFKKRRRPGHESSVGTTSRTEVSAVANIISSSGGGGGGDSIMTTTITSSHASSSHGIEHSVTEEGKPISSRIHDRTSIGSSTSVSLQPSSTNSTHVTVSETGTKSLVAGAVESKDGNEERLAPPGTHGTHTISTPAPAVKISMSFKSTAPGNKVARRWSEES